MFLAVMSGGWLETFRHAGSVGKLSVARAGRSFVFQVDARIWRCCR